MKKLFFIAGFLGLASLSGCAPAQQTIQGYSMTYSCNGNISCINNFHKYSGSGDFSSESDCLIWETAFLNTYYGVSCTACTAHY